MPLERVYLIRHGQTDWNANGRWQGHEMVPLNDLGVEQSQQLADYLKNRPICTIYSSDLNRASVTADIIGDALNLTPILDPRLRELGLGIFQGLSTAEIQERYPDELTAFKTDQRGYQVPNGESRLMLQARAYECWQEITGKGDGEEIAVVAHGGTIKMLLDKLFPERADIFGAHLYNTSVSIVEHIDDGWRLTQFNSTPHLSTTPPDQDEH